MSASSIQYNQVRTAYAEGGKRSKKGSSKARGGRGTQAPRKLTPEGKALISQLLGGIEAEFQVRLDCALVLYRTAYECWVAGST